MAILIVDDVEANLSLLAAVSEGLGRPEIITTTCPEQGLALARQRDFSLVLVDYKMPGMSGVDFIRALRALPRHAETPVIMVTSADRRAIRIEAIEAGATDFALKPVDPIELKARARNLLKLADAQAELKRRASTLESEVSRATAILAAREEEVIFRLARAAEFRDRDTGDHICRTATMAQAIARALGLAERFCRDLYLATPMHDIGKLGISDLILNKPGALTSEERREIELHVTYGADILSGSTSDLIRLAAEIALTHHERWDGSGYPSGLVGEEIPISGRIVAVADVFDALTSARSYKAAWSREAALAHMEEEAGRLYDPACVAALLSSMTAIGVPDTLQWLCVSERHVPIPAPSRPRLVASRD